MSQAYMTSADILPTFDIVIHNLEEDLRFLRDSSDDLFKRILAES